ncbi:dihydrodipicolinate synthase/N-acetylneuraminate lyase [Opitutaceae bacterium TAV1]|nr:dihydrodipicolinate synthase/N-acetylneuraminate lyase [Opitutaceae bacterium TAV1]
MTIHTQGLIAAALTPFDADGELAPERVPDLRDFLKARGVAGVFIGGTTGEWPSLTTAERLQLAQAWLTQRTPGLQVFVHVGHTSLREARLLARKAEELGADAVATVAPLIFRPADADGLVDYCAEIASAAPTLPFYFYHFPALTSIAATGLEILKKAAARIPNFRGLKYTHETLSDYAACALYDGGRYDILFGRDEMLLGSLAMGARASIGSTYNFSSPLSLRVMESFAEGRIDDARRWQMQANRVLELVDTHGGGKAMMTVLGCPCGGCRKPQKAFTGKMVKNLRAALESENLWEMLWTPDLTVSA